MAGKFTENTVFGRGRRSVDIPAQLIAILEATYRDGKDFLIPGEEDDPEVEELIRYGRIHARRRELSFRHCFTDDGKLRFRMSDKRVYVKKNPEFWSAK